MSRTFTEEQLVDLISEACQSRGLEAWAFRENVELSPEMYPQNVRPWVDMKSDFELVVTTYINETITPPTE